METQLLALTIHRFPPAAKGRTHSPDTNLLGPASGSANAHAIADPTPLSSLARPPSDRENFVHWTAILACNA